MGRNNTISQTRKRISQTKLRKQVMQVKKQNHKSLKPQIDELRVYKSNLKIKNQQKGNPSQWLI